MLSDGSRSSSDATQWFDRSTTWKPSAQDITPDREQQAQRRQRPVLCCVQCQHRITEYAARMEYAGAHRHVFTNPGGFSYEIALFEAADCVQQGPPTIEYTWFSGYTWQLALCRNCHSHLGWRYRRLGESGFYGLILSRLVEVDT